MVKEICKDKLFQRERRKSLRKNFLGPVTSLEEYVPQNWWRYLFNSIYLKTDGDVVENMDITKSEVDYFSDILHLSSDNKILDLCCGQGRHSLELARRGFHYVEGLDRSRYLIHLAKKTARTESLGVKFREGDARKLPYPSDAFDAVMILGNSFGYFETVEEDLRVLREVYRVLRPWGKLLLDVANGEYLKENYQPRSWEWIDSKHLVCRERSLSVDRQRLISREVVIHASKGTIVDQFYAERLYDEERLVELIRIAGFSDTEVHGMIETQSERNQDLGMMANRIVLTSRTKKDWTPVKRKPEKDVRNVVVILGDPKKPDLLKPGSVFDDDDIYTIDQLKSALRELKEYNFNYLDNHEMLIHNLLKLNPDFVFNLCDEGFDNDPRKELHVPALLEMLNLPYTGSNPQCIAFCYDKSLVRGIAKEMGIPIPQGDVVKPEDTTFHISSSFPVIIKPNFGDSSFGITEKNVVYTPEKVAEIVSSLRNEYGYDKPILIEEFLTGKDLSVAIIGNPPEMYRVLPIIETDYSELPSELPKICGYESKWLPDSPYFTKLKSIPAQHSEETEKAIIEWCLQLFVRLDCRDYVRFDWRCDNESEPKLLEVNPNPGWCWDGHLNAMAKVAGMSYVEMLEAILRAAEQRVGIQITQNFFYTKNVGRKLSRL